MHNPTLLRLARTLLPGWLRARLDPVHDRMQKAVAAFAASLPPGTRLLDAGAGECVFQPLFHHVRYVAVDSGVGDRNWDYTGLTTVADLTALPFRDQSFDAAISIAVFEHLREPAAALSELRRVLRPGAQIMIVLPQFWELHQAPHDYFRYTRFGVEYLLRRSGFTLVRLQPTGGYFQLIGKLSIDLLQLLQNGWRRVFWVLLAPLFGVALPLACYYLDKLDRRCDFAAVFVVVAAAAPAQAAVDAETATQELHVTAARNG